MSYILYIVAIMVPAAANNDIITELISKASTKHKLERRLLSCLYYVESSYRVNVISNTEDYGIGQINGVTARALKIDTYRLVTDLAYSVDQSAAILSHYMSPDSGYAATTLVRAL